MTGQSKAEQCECGKMSGWLVGVVRCGGGAATDDQERRGGERKSESTHSDVMPGVGGEQRRIGDAIAGQFPSPHQATARRARDAAATILRRQGCAVRRKQSVAPAVYHHAMCRSSGWRRRDLERASRLTSIFHMDTILLRGEASARLPLSRCRGADDGR